MKKMLAVMATAVLIPIAAFAQQPDRAQQVQKLYELSQDVLSQKIVPVRGGAKDKPLGVYIGSPKDVEFKSGYKDVDAKTQCEWAYDLHTFIVESGGGWDNYLKYRKDQAPPNDLNDSLRSAAGGKDPTDAMDRAHVPYDKQAAFADTWWKKNSQSYAKAVLPPKEWWTNDAVLDGNNLWMRWEQQNGKGSADYVMWRDAEIATLLNKK